MDKRTVLITGAAGFIGSRLTGLLLSRGYRCIGVDNLSVGCSPLAPQQNLVFTIQDICDADGMKALFAEFVPHVAVHLAAIHHIPTCEQSPSEALRVNVVGTQHVLDAAAVACCTRFVFASTGGVYDWVDGPLLEETPVRATDIYTLSKIANEGQISLWAESGGRTAVIARIFNTIGEGDLNGHLIPEILRQLKPDGERALLRLGNLNTCRDFIYVDDVAACLAAMVQAQNLQTVEIFNVGTGREYDVRSIAECIARIKGCGVEIETDQTRARRVDRMSQKADIRKVMSKLNWSVEYEFEQALQLIVARTRL